MKFKLALIASTLILSGCGTIKSNENTTAPATVQAPQITAINNQALSTSFKRQGVKIEWDCVWGTGIIDATCVKTQIKAIEVVGYATSFGNSAALRENAFIVAEMDAKAKLSRFLRDDVSSSRVVNTMVKNIEKAQDRVKQRISSTEEVSMTDEEAGKDTNFSVRQNNNEIVRTTTEVMRSNSQAILRGVQTIREEVVDKQMVAVTIRWTKNFQTAVGRFN